MKRTLATILLLSLPSAAPSIAGDAIRVWMEHASDLSGPWEKIDLCRVPTDQSGNPVLPLDMSRGFFRTQMQIVPDGQGTTIPLAEIPEQTLKLAEDMLRDGKSGEEGWPADCVLGPLVFPVYDKASNGGATPAFLEFKVVRGGTATPPRTGFPLHFDDDPARPDAGMLLVSLTDAESPRQESTQEGVTITERLWKLAGRRDVKIFRFSADFFVAEDLAGNMVANFGTQPFKPDPTLPARMTGPAVWEGDTDTGLNIRPELPRFEFATYHTYPEFCTDYLTNPVYVKLRQRRAIRSVMERNIERGVLPQVISLRVGESIPILPTDQISEFEFDSDDGDIARITRPTEGGGLLVYGSAPGNGILNLVRGTAGSPASFAIQVLPAVGVAARKGRGTFTPGWQTVAEYYVGTKDNQVRYEQLKSADWPGYVGCGPNAWALLLAWYEREKGLVPAYGNLVTADAPFECYNDSPASVKAKLKPVVGQLRSLCGTFDDPFSDASPTMPGEMPDGVIDYLFIPFTAQMLSYGWKARWSDLFQTLNGGGGAVEVREAIVKKNRCACVGLGNYWHYALAYGYRRQDYKVTENGPALYCRRQLRCNMGWGGDDGNWRWRDFYDTFFAMNLRLSKGPLYPQQQ